jgi:hypothetical protein
MLYYGLQLLIVRKDRDNEISSFSIKTLNIGRKNTTTGAI